jgi:hypothetical protein
MFRRLPIDQSSKWTKALLNMTLISFEVKPRITRIHTNKIHRIFPTLQQTHQSIQQLLENCLGFSCQA